MTPDKPEVPRRRAGGWQWGKGVALLAVSVFTGMYVLSATAAQLANSMMISYLAG